MSHPADTLVVMSLRDDLSFLPGSKRPGYEQAPDPVVIVDLFSGCGGLTLGLAEAARRLGMSTLRDAQAGLTDQGELDDEQWGLARHVVDENQRTLLAAAALTTGDLDTLGELMFDSHASLRDLYRVSCAELDALVETAAALRNEGGVIGARMTGAGFGGCAVVMCHAGAAESVSREIERRFNERFGHPPACFEVRPVGAARAVNL